MLAIAWVVCGVIPVVYIWLPVVNFIKKKRKNRINRIIIKDTLNSITNEEKIILRGYKERRSSIIKLPENLPQVESS